MKLNLLKQKISKIPVIVKDNKESLLCMGSDISIFEGEELVKNIDDSTFRFDFQNIAILKENIQCRYRFPIINIKEPFWEFDFNEHLFQNFELARKLFIKQSEIKNFIANKSKKKQLTVLVIIDGLSYMDCTGWDNVSPCLVDTITNTECGFSNIVGISNSIAYNLFQKELSNFIGFSYWDRENKLTERVFKNISPLFKINRFSEILEKLNGIKLGNTYIQIVLNGLDNIAHRYRDEPPIKPIVTQLYDNLLRLYQTLEDSAIKGNFFATSDHGILWKHRENLTEIAPDITSGKVHPRYYSNKLNNPRVFNFHIVEKNYSALKHPFITRKLRSNEWGTHGGISLAESIVPFLHWKIN